jgi:pentafunctional AROM polypeptide
MADQRTHFYLFGSPIKQSLSPTLHNTGFRFHNLPYDYSLHETEDFASVKAKICDPTTAGGSVTIPHKQSVMSVVDKLSNAAKAIGAVNTIYKVCLTGSKRIFAICWAEKSGCEHRTTTERYMARIQIGKRCII